jgi:hypothetical protein
MPIRLTLLTLLCALLLTPAAAVAQSAGDEQYEDPFPTSQPNTQATPAPTQAPAAAPAQATPTPTPAGPKLSEDMPTGTATATAPSTAQPKLPRTGGDAWLAALLGLDLLPAGVALRAHARRAT